MGQKQSGQLQSYYRILGLEADASTEEIHEAIRNMRDLDTEGNYTAILNKIEKTLLPLSSRPKVAARNGVPHGDAAPENEWQSPEFPDFEPRRSAPAEAPAPEKPRFLDLGSDEEYGHASRIDRTPVQDHRSYITEEEIRAYNRPPSLIGKILNFRNVVLLLLAVGVGIAGFIFGMPLYQQYLANKQGGEAMPVLTRAKDEADAFLRKNKYFPESLSGAYNSPLYTVRANSGDETVLLTFSQEAAEPLRGHSLVMKTEVVANIGLQWRCSISAGFPQMHKPAQCY